MNAMAAIIYTNTKKEDVVIYRDVLRRGSRLGSLLFPVRRQIRMLAKINTPIMKNIKEERMMKKRSTFGLIIDFMLVFATGGLWLIWLLIRYLRNS